MDPDVDTEKNTAKQKRKPSKKAAESKEQQDLDQLEKEQSNKTATQTEARFSNKVKVTSNHPKVQEQEHKSVKREGPGTQLNRRTHWYAERGKPIKI